MSSSFQRGLIATRSGGDIPFSPAQIPDIFCWFRGNLGADIVSGKYVSVIDQAAPEYVFAQSNAARRPDASTWGGKITPVYNRDAIANMVHTASAADWSWLLDGSDWTCIWRHRKDWMGDAYPIVIGTWGAGFFGFRNNVGTNDNRIVFYLRSGGAHLTGYMLVNQNPSSPYLTVSVTSKDQVVTLRNNEFERSVAWVPPAEPDFVAGLNIGSAQGVTTSPIPEVIFYRRALDETELTKLTTYLETEWPETSPIFSMMGNDPDAVIEDDKFVSIPDRGNVPGAVVAQSVVGRRPEVVQWGGDGELCPRFTASNSALGSDRDANDFACLTDGKDDVLITYRYLLEETPYSPMGAFSTVPEGNTNAPGMTAHLDAVAAEGISNNEALFFSTIDGVGIRSFSNRGPVSLGTAVTMQYHVSHSAVRFFFDGNLTRTWSRTDPRYDWSAAALSLGRYRSAVTANGLSNPLAAFRIDPGPISTEMMRGIREEIESVYPDVVANNIADLYAAKPGVVFDESMLHITSAPGLIIQNPVVQYLGMFAPDGDVLLSDDEASTEAFIRSNFSVAVQPILGETPEHCGFLYAQGTGAPAISAVLTSAGKVQFELSPPSDDRGPFARIEFSVNRQLLSSKILQFSRVDNHIYLHIGGTLVAQDEIDAGEEYVLTTGNLSLGSAASVLLYTGAWEIGSVADILRVYRKVRDIVSPWTEDPVVVHADVSDPSTVITSGAITSITNKGSLGGQFLPVAAAPGVVQVNGLNAAGFVVGIERMELQGPEKEGLKFLHDNTVPWQMTVVAKWGTQRQAYADLCGNIGSGPGDTGGAYLNKRPSSILCGIDTNGPSWSDTSPNGTASEGDVGVVTLRFTPGDPALLELFIDGVLEITSTRDVSVSFPLTSNPTSPFTVGPGESGGDFDVCEIIVEKDHVDRYAELAAKWVEPAP